MAMSLGRETVQRRLDPSGPIVPYESGRAHPDVANDTVHAGTTGSSRADR
jgi:hypothetical protein